MVKMFKTVKWRRDKRRFKAVFKLQFRVTQVQNIEWDALTVTLVSAELGKPNLRSEKSTIVNGTCQWMNPSYQTVKFTQDSITGKINDKICKFIVTAHGLEKNELLGEISINIADYAKIVKPASVTLPLHDSENGAILHVIIQRMQDDVERRETNENGDSEKETNQNKDIDLKQQERKTLRSQLSASETEESEFSNGIDAIEDRTFINLLKTQPNMLKTQPNMLNRNLDKSSSLDLISSSESSSEQYTPNENGIMNNNLHQDNALSHSHRSDLNVNSTNSSAEIETENALEKVKGDPGGLARNLQVSDIELQTLRKQIVKEKRRGEDIFRELSSLKVERDFLRKEYEDLKASKKRAVLHLQNDNSEYMTKERKEEMYVNKNLNTNIAPEMQKMQDANSELMLTVRDLEEQLEQKSKEVACTLEEKRDMTYNNYLTCSRNLGDLDKECDEMATCSQEEKIFYLKSELELYRKDREDLQVHMEQLALDYEILKQENHIITSRLENAQLQLRMQYECSTHTAITYDLELQIKMLEKEIEKQSREYEDDLANIIQSKVKEEQRAIQAEKELIKTRWMNANTVEQLQHELKNISSKFLTVICANEEVVMGTLEKCRELHQQNLYLMSLLRKKNDELTLMKNQDQVKWQQLLSLIDSKTKEIDRLHMEHKNYPKNLSSTTEESDTDMYSQVRNNENIMLEKEYSVSKEAADKTMEELNSLRQLKEEQDDLIKTLTSKLQTVTTQYTELKNLLSCDEIEQENLRKQVVLLRGDLKKDADIITKIEKRLKDNNAKLKVSEGTMVNIRNKSKRTREISTDPQIGDILNVEFKPNYDNSTTEKILNNDHSIGIKLVEHLHVNYHHGIKSDLDVNANIELDSTNSFTDEQSKLAELQSEMMELKDRNKEMEAELQHMHEKYSEMCLKLAQIEGEKQQLVIRVRTLKYSMKN